MASSKTGSSQAGASASKAAGKPKEKGKKPQKNKILEEQILAMGGDKSDMDLVSGIQDVQLVQEAQAEDPELADDVSKFLRGLKSGADSRKTTVSSDDKAKSAKKAKDTKSKTKPATEKAEEKPSVEAKPSKKSKEKKPKGKTNPPEEPEEKSTVTLPPPSLPTLNKTHQKLTFPPNAHWYTALAPLAPPVNPPPTPSTSQISSLSERAATLLAADATTAILSKGTLSDRLSALTLLVQASPVHNVKALETLKGMAERGRGKGGREEGLKAMRCVIDWWVGGGAPGRKLKYLRDQPLLHPSVTDEYLVMWYFEDWLKKFFYSVLQVLETYSLDPLPYVRTQALGFIATLLREKPEQEQNLLRLLVNKLGDTERSVCSRASYHLLQVLQTHPAMKGVIVREIRSLIFRPAASTSEQAQAATEKQNNHVRFGDDDVKPTKKPQGKDKTAKSSNMERWNSHAWYYSAVTLNQVVLTPSEQERAVARTLIDVYFEMFREILGGFVGPDPKQTEAANEEVHDETHDGSKKKGKAKEVRGDAGFAEVEDANSRLISAVLSGVNRALPFAKVDMGAGNDSFQKHIDTLFLITHTSTFNISLQALMLILQISTTISETTASSSKDAVASFSDLLKGRFYRTLYSSLLDPRLASSNKQAMYLNLLFKALKADSNVERVKAFVRRFIQILVVGIGGTGGAEFIAGGLYLLGELFSTVPGLRSMFSGSVAQELPLIHHYHPAVSLHARQLLSSKPVTATPDLSLNTLSHFLDRFVYKNPKKPKPKGASVMQPAASTADGASGVKLMKGEVVDGAGPVNDEKWWRRRVEDVPVDQLFFHKYFTKRSEKEKVMADKVKKRKGHEDDASDEEGEEEEEDEDEEEMGVDVAGPEEEQNEDEDSDKEEAEIWKAIKATMPAELQDDDLSDDSDDVPSDLDAEDSGDEEVEENEDEDASEKAESEKEDQVDDDDALSMVEASDAEDLIDLDEDAPDGLIEFDGSESEGGEEEWGGISGAVTNKKRKRGGEEESKRSKKKKLRSLPTFASYEDYAKLIEDGPEDNI
ncbi:hypothetical protein EW026_g4738 [Hermanssonia centrifuga]|uniref:CCAAT-binding factor domain-containing protein n=1 Tax=Hermanssonia centrifuga TaxID=98765 RepID=A0A4V3XA90_9APHY|nr:hypothetical protein EW026_g4738 [Hermanssonia centrifuga]